MQSIGAANQTTSYAYDNVGNITQVTDPLSHVTGQSFDALNRLIQVAAPLSSTTAYGYDAHDNRTSVTDPRGLATSYVYDGLDNLIEVSSPDTGATVYVVDDAGNRIQQTDAAGVVMQMSYDALNRTTAKTYPADPAENVTYRYDEPAAGFGIGRLTSVTDSSGGTRMSSAGKAMSRLTPTTSPTTSCRSRIHPAASSASRATPWAASPAWRRRRIHRRCRWRSPRARPMRRSDR